MTVAESQDPWRVCLEIEAVDVGGPPIVVRDRVHREMSGHAVEKLSVVAESFDDPCLEGRHLKEARGLLV